MLNSGNKTPVYFLVIRVFTFCWLLFLIPHTTKSQDFDEMSKSELRQIVYGFSKSLDSITQQNQKLLVLSNNLKDNVRLKDEELVRVNSRKLLLEKELSGHQSKERELAKLNDLIQTLNTEISSFKDSIIILNKQIELLDSIYAIDSERLKKNLSDHDDSLKLLRSKLTESGITVNDESEILKKDDFLNNYFVNPIPLNNETFKMVLRKVILEGRYLPENVYDKTVSEKDYAGFYRGKFYIGERDYNYNDDKYYNYFQDIPELLNAERLSFFRAKPNMKVESGKDFNEFVAQTTLQNINSDLPTIEILKNKLFTLKYPSGSEESFLFNVRKSAAISNNQRYFLQVELANEEVKTDGSDNEARDMVWRIYIIGEECYIALSARQLKRLGLRLYDSRDGINVFTSDGEEMVSVRNNYGYYSSGRGIYLGRKKDVFMESSHYLDPNAVIYLFKLVKSN